MALKHKQVVFILIAVVILIAGFGISKYFGSKKPMPKAIQEIQSEKALKVGVAEYKDYQTKVSSYGRLKSGRRIEIFSEVGGILENGSNVFKTGNKFSNGQLLLKVDDREVKLQLYSQKSDFMRLLTTILPDIQTDFSSSFGKWNKYLESLDINEPLDSLPKPSTNKEKYFLSSKNVFTNYYNIKNTELRLSKHVVKAPFTGEVIQHAVETGSLVRVGQKLGEFVSTEGYELEVAIESSEISYIKAGINVRITDEDTGKEFNGKILRITNFIDANTQTVKVYISVNGAGLRDGMYLRADIDGDLLKNVISLPRSALINKRYVNVLNDKNEPIKTPVSIVRLTETTAYIRGLDNNEKIIIEPLVNFVPGTKIKPIMQ